MPCSSPNYAEASAYSCFSAALARMSFQAAVFRLCAVAASARARLRAARLSSIGPPARGIAGLDWQRDPMSIDALITNSLAAACQPRQSVFGRGQSDTVAEIADLLDLDARAAAALAGRARMSGSPRSRKPAAPGNRLGGENLRSSCRRRLCFPQGVLAEGENLSSKPLSTAFSMAYEPHPLRWMLPGES